jgi:hypothetical protein
MGQTHLILVGSLYWGDYTVDVVFSLLGFPRGLLQSRGEEGATSRHQHLPG